MTNIELNTDVLDTFSNNENHNGVTSNQPTTSSKQNFVSLENMEEGDSFYGRVTSIKGGPNNNFKTISEEATWTIVGRLCDEVCVPGEKPHSFRLRTKSGKDRTVKLENIELLANTLDKNERANMKEKTVQKIEFDKLETSVKLTHLISTGFKNIWLTGPAGCGDIVL